MKSILVYDDDKDRLEELCDRFNLSLEEIVEILLDNSDDDMFE